MATRRKSIKPDGKICCVKFCENFTIGTKLSHSKRLLQTKVFQNRNILLSPKYTYTHIMMVGKMSKT